MKELNENHEKIQDSIKENFEPLEANLVEVKVEKGYAASSGISPSTGEGPMCIDQWEQGEW